MKKTKLAATVPAETNKFLLPVMEHFYTIQGEGFHQGKAAYFIRLAGCDVGCSWCDVKESWDAQSHSPFLVEEIAGWVEKSPADICVVTGGEPAMHPLSLLTELLHWKKIRTHIETSGAHPLSGKWNWICISPKRFKLPLANVLQQADELKIVIAHRNDFRFAKKYAKEVSKKCLLFLQPEWSVREEIIPEIINYVKENPQWQISLQIHKYLNVP